MTATARVGGFPSRGQAELARGHLAEHGIDAEVIADDAGGTAPHISFGAGGIYLEVNAHDADRADQLLSNRGDDTDATPHDRRRPTSMRRVAEWGVGVAVVLLVVLFVVNTLVAAN